MQPETQNLLGSTNKPHLPSAYQTVANYPINDSIDICGMTGLTDISAIQTVNEAPNELISNEPHIILGQGRPIVHE